MKLSLTIILFILCFKTKSQVVEKACQDIRTIINGTINQEDDEEKIIDFNFSYNIEKRRFLLVTITQRGESNGRYWKEYRPISFGNIESIELINIDDKLKLKLTLKRTELVRTFVTRHTNLFENDDDDTDLDIQTKDKNGVQFKNIVLPAKNDLTDKMEVLNNSLRFLVMAYYQ